MFTIIRNIAIKTFLAFVLIALASADISFSGPASATESNTYQAAEETDAIAVNPASSGQPDKSRTRFDYNLNPGQPARDSIYVANTGTSIQDVTLYARDAFLGTEGDFLIQDQSVEPKDAGSWVLFEGDKKVLKFTLKPRGFMTVPFTVFTPVDATPGDHAGAIVASAITKGSTINIVRRVAVRLYARLSGDLKAKLEISNVSTQSFPNPFNPFDSKQIVSYDISNVGNIELSADITVSTAGPFGLVPSSPESVRVTNLLPGSTRRVSQKVSGAGALGLSTASIVYTGLFTSTSVTPQQPRGREDFSSVGMVAGWALWLSGFFVALAIWGLRRQKRATVKSRGEQLEKAN
jgi:dihydroorotate dehydrogenase (fumarate)